MAQVVVVRNGGGRRRPEKGTIDTRNAGFLPRQPKTQSSDRVEGEQLLLARETTAQPSPSTLDFAKLYERPATTQQPKPRTFDCSKRVVHDTAPVMGTRQPWGKRK